MKNGSKCTFSPLLSASYWVPVKSVDSLDVLNYKNNQFGYFPNF